MPEAARDDPAELGSLDGLEFSVNCTDGGFRWTVGGYENWRPWLRLRLLWWNVASEIMNGASVWYPSWRRPLSNDSSELLYRPVVRMRRVSQMWFCFMRAKKTATVMAAMLVNTPVWAVHEMNVSILFGFSGRSDTRFFSV